MNHRQQETCLEGSWATGPREQAEVPLARLTWAASPRHVPGQPSDDDDQDDDPGDDLVRSNRRADQGHDEDECHADVHISSLDGCPGQDEATRTAALSGTRGCGR